MKKNRFQACLIHQTTFLFCYIIIKSVLLPYLTFFGKLNQLLMTTNNVALLFHIQSNPRYFNDIVNLIRQSALVSAVHMLTVHNTRSIQLAVRVFFRGNPA